MTTAPAPWRVAVADARHHDAVGALRREAYRGATEFRWRDEAQLDWSAADDAGAVLVLLDDRGALYSTVRATVYTDLARAEEVLEYSLAGMPVRAPLLVASRACTRPCASRRGLLTHVRRAYVGAAQALPEIACAITLVYDGAPRLRSMRDTGFTFHAPRQGWDSEAVALTQPLMAVLQRADFARALGVMAGMQAPGENVAIDADAIARVLRSRGPAGAVASRVACPA